MSVESSLEQAEGKEQKIDWKGSYPRHRLYVRRYLQSFFRSKGGLSSEDLEDLTQETFLQITRAFPAFRGESPLEAWIHRIALNVALQHMRYRNTRRNVDARSTDEVDTGELACERDFNRPDRAVQYADLSAFVERLLEKGSPVNKGRDAEKVRAIFRGTCEGDQHMELAESLDMDPGTVRTTLTHIRKGLRVCVEKELMLTQ